MSTLGERLKTLRQSKEMTQEDLASQLTVNRATLANWEINRTQPDYDSLHRIADYFGVSLDYLLGREPQSKSPSFGSILKQLRRDKGYSQRELAQLLGISNSTVAMWESDARLPEAEMLRKISDMFGVSTDYLLDRELQLPSTRPPWMDKLKPETRAHLEAVGGLRGFHTRFLGGKGLNDLAPETLEIIMESYFEHLEREAAVAKKAKEGKMDGDD